MPRTLRILVVALAVLVAGCEGEPYSFISSESGEVPPPPTIATVFDPTKCGRVTGRVTWAGSPPTATAFVYGVPKTAGGFDVQLIPNPNAPQVSTESNGVGNAVVFLRGVWPAAAKPWDHPPVRVELANRNIVVRQGESGPRRVGFVRRGDPVVMVSAEPVFHILRGRGAAFFSLTFPDSGRELVRVFDQLGRVELSSGAGFYWASADLFVDDHPYYTLTDRDGRFVLDQVPGGSVEVVAWLPGWGVGKQERDPDSGMVARQTYTPPKEATGMASVTVAGTATVELTIR